MEGSHKGLGVAFEQTHKMKRAEQADTGVMSVLGKKQAQCQGLA